jgi:hypothetical protein
MSAARRQIIRPQVQTSERDHRLRIKAKLLARVESEKTVLARWMSRLKRAFHQVEKLQARLNRLQNQIIKLESMPCQESSR